MRAEACHLTIFVLEELLPEAGDGAGAKTGHYALL